MSHRECPAIPPGHDGYVLGGSREDRQLDNIPNGTYIMCLSDNRRQLSICYLHPVGTFCQDINHQLLILLFPSSILYICIDDGLDEILDVLHLSPFVVY